MPSVFTAKFCARIYPINLLFLWNSKMFCGKKLQHCQIKKKSGNEIATNTTIL